MTIAFPDGFSLSGSCDFDSATTILGSASCSSDSDLTLTVNNLLNADYTGGASSWTFTIGPVTMPESTASLSSFVITTLSGGLEVDTYSSAFPVTLSEGSIAAAAVPENYESYQEAEYTFTFTPAHDVPARGYIVITYPEEISIEDASYSQSQCGSFNNFPSVPVCTIDTGNRYITVTKGFRQEAGSAGTEYSLAVPKMTNPLSTSASSSFQIMTYNEDGEAIDKVSSGITVTMAESSTIYSVELALSTYQNAAMTEYTFIIVSIVPITEDDYLVITFPPEIELPWQEELDVAYSDSTSLISGISGKVDVGDSTVTLAFTLADDVTEIAILESFELTVGDMTNPNSTAESSDFSLEFFDKSDNSISSRSSGVTVSTTTAATLEEASVVQTSSGASETTSYTFTITPLHDIGAGGQIIIDYPS
jgi:hypothetical protein